MQSFGETKMEFSKDLKRLLLNLFLRFLIRSVVIIYCPVLHFASLSCRRTIASKHQHLCRQRAPELTGDKVASSELSLS